MNEILMQLTLFSLGTWHIYINIITKISESETVIHTINMANIMHEHMTISIIIAKSPSYGTSNNKMQLNV